MTGQCGLRIAVCLAMAVFVVVVVQGVAVAASAGVSWKVSLVAQPSNFAVTGSRPGEPVDQYSLVLTNTGGIVSSGRITLTDTLPAHATVGVEGIVGNGWECPADVGSSVISCVYEGVPALGQSPVLKVPLAVGAQDAGLNVVNSVVVSGGGASVATANVSTVVDAEEILPFDFLDFASQVSDISGAPDTQAGGHPYAFTTSMDFPEREVGGIPLRDVQSPKDMEIELPLGLIGDPQAASRCAIVDFFAKRCQPSSRVGTFFINFAEGYFSEEHSSGYPIYNIVPEHGYPAEFGLFAEQINRPALLYASVGPPPEYGLHVSAPDIPPAAGVTSVIVTFFGDPQGMDGGVNSSVPFLTNPSDCSGAPLVTRIEAETWEEQGTKVHDAAEAPPVAGCDLLRFEPSISLAPETTLADEPSGYTFDLQVPQSKSTSLESPATPDVKNVTVTLPRGVSIDPSAADGLGACPATGPEGFNLEGPEAVALNTAGAETSVSGHCPLDSQIATVEATTPLLAEPLHGHVYVAQPQCGGENQEACTQADAQNGRLFSLDMQLEGSGVVIKLHGIASANPSTGQLTVTFRENPQDPISDIKLNVTGGPRAPLANPQTCGEATTTSDITPWSSPETPDGTPSSAFEVTGCEGNPFAPSFTAGTTSTNAGAYTTFTATFDRPDRQQDLDAIQVTTPPGLLGMLSHVTLCGEPQAAQGACPSSSAIGTATASAGAGSHPYWVNGPVYLTGPYRGAPFGLSIVVAAKAGPFNLGTVVVRSAITIDPNTSALTITSDPLPQILDGVTLRSPDAERDRRRAPGSCSTQPTAGPNRSPARSPPRREPSASRLAIRRRRLRGLPVQARSSRASTRAKTSKLNGASLTVKVASSAGQANIGKVDVQLTDRRCPHG